MDRAIFSIGNFNVYWYSVLIIIAFIIGSSIAIKYTRKTGIGEIFIIDLIFALIPISIIGARLYYVIFNFDYYRNDLLSIFKIWEGGLAIYGGIIASVVYTAYYCHKKSKPFIEVLDIFVASLILGQAIGRWGNFFNGEAYGPATTLSFLQSIHLPQFIIDGMNINGVYHQPLFLYESILCLIGFIIIMMIRKRIPITGVQTFFYCVWYGLGRIIIEHFRTDSLYFMNFKISQIVSLILIIIGIIGFIRIIMIKKSKNKFIVTRI